MLKYCFVGRKTAYLNASTNTNIKIQNIPYSLSLGSQLDLVVDLVNLKYIIVIKQTLMHVVMMKRHPFSDQSRPHH